MKKQIYNSILCISIILFILSLTQIAYSTKENSVHGWFALCFGAIGVMAGGACLSWLANPFILFSWLFVKKIKQSLIFSCIAVACGSSFLLFDQVIIDEAGHYATIIQRNTGYWLWLFSMIIMFVMNIFRYLSVKFQN